MKSVEEQIERIRRLAAEIVPEEELIDKIKKASEDNKPLRVKLGLDPTAPDIHIGHALPLHLLRTFQDCGHHAVLIIGDYTATIGDPSGQNTMRPQLEHDEVLKNAETYLEQAAKIVDMDEAEIVNNRQWFAKMSLADVIKLAGKLTVARCLERDDFKKRLADQRPVGLHELLYPLMQAYDSVKVESDVELGGTDQIFNILLGRDLQREVGMQPQVAVTNELLVGLDGTEKMSKSKGNYIGINEDPNTMYGKVMSIADELMEKYFYLATALPKARIDQLLSVQTHPREAKAELARAVVTRYHNPESARKAKDEFEKVFKDKQLPTDMPELIISEDDLENGQIWSVALVRASGRAKSNGEARRLIQQGGVSIGSDMDNLEKITDINSNVALTNGLIVKIGKRHFWKIKIEYH